MSRKRFKAEEIVNKLRDANMLIAQGRTVLQTCTQIGVTEQTCYRQRKEQKRPTVAFPRISTKPR